MRRLFFFLLVLLLSPEISAQVRILVKESETGKPLPNAAILNVASGSGLATDSEGLARDTTWREGQTITVSFVGYKTATQTLVSGDNFIFLEVDYMMLSDIVVMGFEDNRKLSQIAAAYSVAPASAFRRFGDDSMVRGMNTLPGIRFEERSPASYRVSIRGSLLRAPFGVRNVKVYWNNIPFTDPNGNTPLNAIDLNNVGKTEVIKGPAGSVFGAGMGGVLNIGSEVIPATPFSASLGFSAGSFGFQKVVANLNTLGKSHSFSMKYANQKADGYRDHTTSDREVIQMGGTFFTSTKRTIGAQMLFSDLNYETPGGLTQQQYDENPRQARPGAEKQNASIDNQYFLAGVVQDYVWNEKVNNTTSLFFTNNTKENPFINNYELERLNSFGGRSVFNISTSLAGKPMAVTAGGEWNLGRLEASNHGNVNGYADTLRYQDELKSQLAFVFAQASLNLGSKWILTLGASANYLNYDIHRIRDVALDTSYTLNRTFAPQFIPRGGLVGALSETLSFHASISSGFSPPTTEEVRTSDGGINTDLEAEKGVNYEAGVRGNTKDGRLFYDFTTFWMQQSQTIVSKATEGGSVVFENAGATSQPGAEALLSYLLIKNPAAFLSQLRFQVAYTWNKFTFRDYEKVSGGENVDYSGNALTGTAPNIVVATIDLESKSGIYLNFTHNFTDKIPVNDANTVYADAYNLMSLKVGYTTDCGKRHKVDIYAGIDNILNEKYSLGNDLNAFGGRYFNAAPERNYFGGIRFYFNNK